MTKSKRNYGLGIQFWRIELLANQRRESEASIIKKILNNKCNWIESEKASLFWDGREWSVNKMVEDESDFIIHEFSEDELDKAIEQFVEHTQEDKLSRTDEEVFHENSNLDRKSDL